MLLTGETVVDREDEDTQQQANRCGDGQGAAFRFASGVLDGRVVDVLEWSLIEVTLRV